MKAIKGVPLSEIHFEYTRSSGSGGQHINRTNTAVILRWNALTTHSFSSEMKEQVLNHLETKLTNSGDLLIRSEDSRDQDINKKHCLEKFEKILAAALFIPKKRKKTKPSKAAREKRLKSKKQHSKIKKLRKRDF